MNKILKLLGLGLGGLTAVLIIVVGGLVLSTNRRINRAYAVQPVTINIPTDEASLAEGQRLASIYCANCHGEDYGGTEFFKDPALGETNARNLTIGQGGIGAFYSDDDWLRALRHGVKPDGKPVLIMPSQDLYYLADEQLGQIIAYLKTAPPVDREMNTRQFSPLASVLLAVGAFGEIIPAEVIAHTSPPPSPPSYSPTAEYGEYIVLTMGCRTCHGPELAGGPNPEPGGPPGPNLTPGGNLSGWSLETFNQVVSMRDSEFMPYQELRRMTAEEREAVFLYLKSLPAGDTRVN